MRKLSLALGAMVALCCLSFLGRAQAQTPPVTFSVFPVPGTLTASAKTQISFRGGPVASIGTVTVTGSKSGAHTGTLKPHSDGLGASFVPDKAFTGGEKVTVATADQIVGAANGDFSITIGESTGRKNRPVESPKVGNGTVQGYKTRRDLAPPSLTVTTNKPGTAPGLVFLAPKGGRGQDGPMIINNGGKLVWFKPMQGKLAADFRVQTYDGKPVLTWWEGVLYGGDGDGVGEILDQSYNPVAQVHAGNGYSFDIHEFTITPQNTALVIAYERDKRDLRPWGGRKDARIVDNIVQEIDLKTGLVLFEWHSFGNVSPADSYTPVPKDKGFEWEYFHANAVDARHGRQLPRLRPQRVDDLQDQPGDRQDHVAAGRQALRLQARQGRAVRLPAQHPPPGGRHADAVRQLRGAAARRRCRARSRSVWTRRPRRRRSSTPSRTRTSCCPRARATTSACPTATSSSAGARSATSPSSVRPARCSSTATSPRATTTTAPSGTSGPAPRPPRRRPSPAPTASNITATVSWNGATSVARWELLAGADANSLAPVGSAGKAGFETTVTAKSTAAFIAMRAYDAAGTVLGTSPAIRPAK